MIRYIKFSENGIKDISFLKESDFNIIDDKDSDYGKALTILLESTFYPRVKIIGKRITRDIYSGYLFLKGKIKKGDIVTISNLKLESLSYEEVNVSLELINSVFESPISVSKKEVSCDLENAKLVFLVGRGIKNKETYEKIKDLAKKFGAEIACTRPVCMNNWESFDRFVGISGKNLNSDLVVTFGVGGSKPLMNGLTNVKKIVSINNDKDSLIFKYSDYGIVEDLNIICRELTNE